MTTLTMTGIKSRTSLLACAATIAGASATAMAQDKGDEPCKPLFVSTATLLDADAASPLDANRTAGIDDLVIDTRNGKVLYAIIDTNEILGSDNKVVAVPFGACAWDAPSERFVLHLTADELKSLPPCDTDELERLEDRSWHSLLQGVFGNTPELAASTWDGDEYTLHFENGGTEAWSGKVMGVDRSAKSARGATLCAVTVDVDGDRRTVLLAPATHLKQNSCMPSEGDLIEVETVRALGHDDSMVYVARELERGEVGLELRDDKGVPQWTMRGDLEQPRYLALASDLDDGTLYSKGKEFGNVSDTAIEVQSGTTAFAVISMGGVLGVDDTLYPIPCGAFMLGSEFDLYVGDMAVRDMARAPKLSSYGVADLNDSRFADSVLEYYEVETKTYDTDRTKAWASARAGSNS